MACSSRFHRHARWGKPIVHVSGYNTMNRLTRLAAVPAMIAMLALPSAPAIAAELPARVTPVADAGLSLDEPLSYYGRRWGSRGWYPRRHRSRTSDVLTGVLILGGIAAVASAANRDRYRDRPYRDVRYPQPRYRDEDARGIDRAVSLCVREIERDVRVQRVDSVDRDAGGWDVRGVLFDDQGFACSIDERGRVRDIDYGRGSARLDRNRPGDVTGDDRQWDDARYRQAWAQAERESAPLPRVVDTAQPAYPGGPLPGDDFDETETRDNDLAQAEIGTGYRGRDD